ncbi:MAG: GGDEF domain-containing protein [Pseudomonadota bacterium]
MTESESGGRRTLTIATQADLPAQTLAESGFGPFAVVACESRDAVLACLADVQCDALVLTDDDVAIDLTAEVGRDIAIVVVVADLQAERVLAWLDRGVQDVLTAAELAAPSLAQRVRAAIERKRLERDARTAYATDLDTGLPHQQQLIEHMSQLLALREREPAPMAVLALRIEGLATAEARLGREVANVLRRKVGVRLRAGVRASDVVASLGDDSFAVLLGSILSPADAERVGAKLMQALMQPLRAAGEDLTVATALGIGQYPQDGAQPDALLRRAVGLAAAAQAQGRAGFSNFGAPGAADAGAANDE